MALTLATTVKNSVLDAISALINTGGAGTLEIWTSAFGTKLADLTFNATSFAAASGGSATANAITADSSANATGTAAVFRIKSGGGTTLIDGTVGTTGQDINFNTVSFVTGDNISISALTMAVP